MLKQKKTLKISIGMPVWNGEAFIKDAITSILNQTYDNFELIISDNGSSDGTEIICKNFVEQDKRIKYFRSPINKGGFINFLTVLNKSAGEYFMWGAADDCWDSNWLETLIEECIKNNCIAFGRIKQIDSYGKIIPYPTDNKNLTFVGPLYIRRSKFFFCPGVFGKANLIYGMYPRKILTAENLSVLGGGYKHSDMLFLYQLLKNNKIQANLDTYFYKRVPEFHMSSIYRKKNLNLYKIDGLKNVVSGIESIFGYYKGYCQMSSFIENIVLIFLFPFALCWDLFIRIYWDITLRNNHKN